MPCSDSWSVLAAGLRSLWMAGHKSELALKRRIVMKAERFNENCFPESHPIFTHARTDTCPVPQKHLTRLHFSGRTDCLVNEMSWANAALALRGLFPNYLKRLSTRAETINNKEHFGKLETASWALGNFPVQSTDAECEGTPSPRGCTVEQVGHLSSQQRGVRFLWLPRPPRQCSLTLSPV